eukprot:NODE_3808_length_1981_cov_14.724919.p1 GENE.NODE_3808_length_1981_cov_14.724919~~NODE_3808_length_1981_cov_14.724919.p1  ORF type:complete len:338 (-),score=60.13 NODE_3808_length_1981_cov_14.724919:15-1028(-)
MEAHVKARVTCGSSVSDFLSELEGLVGDACDTLLAFAVPPPGAAPELHRHALACTVLGIRTLPATAPPAGLRRLFTRAKVPLCRWDRLSFRVKELWLCVEDDGGDGDGDGFLTFQVEAPPGAPRSSFRAVLPVGATVAKFRDVMGSDLPSAAEVLVEGRALQNRDRMPRRVNVTAFNGSKMLYADTVPGNRAILRGMLRLAYESHVQNYVKAVLRDPSMQSLDTRHAAMLQIASDMLAPHAGHLLGLPGTLVIATLRQMVFLASSNKYDLLNMRVHDATLWTLTAELHCALGCGNLVVPFRVKLNQVRFAQGLPPWRSPRNDGWSCDPTHGESNQSG